MSLTQRKHYIDGYPSLSYFIASDKDGTSAIFKRFNRLAARDLLILQSELAELEAKLDSFDEEDRTSRESLQALRNWKDYKARNEEDSERRKVLQQIHNTLKEYTLVFESTLATIPPPGRKILKAFRMNFFHGRPEEAGAFPTLGGHGAHLYDDADDLLVLHTRELPDRLTMFVQDYFGFLFEDREQDECGGTTGTSVGYASGQKISAFISYSSTILAALLLTGAIVILYNTNSDNLKLGLIALFTILFSASVGLLTNAKRAEVFGATAA
ncbi:unnamed protein product [Fusarium equiseti]|uniref:DUF6594 domain-containing protein n=1 Tax=Fusarium equiseti TaxID=61235 RepID=A0A8J2J8S4_FUSEQ|nr:unnamed protein product [Fusarium equiseti]